MSGLEARYEVKKINDPEGKHNDCRYFVLDPQHDIYALQALKFYANIVSKTEPQLSKDLEQWTDSLTGEWTK